MSLRQVLQRYTSIEHFIDHVISYSFVIGYLGEEGSMRVVLDKAREYSPCVVILEDLGALINEQNHSFFLNQLDGLESNDGLLVMATTNHFDRLDAGLRAFKPPFKI